MKIELNKGTLLTDIQDQFKKDFPFLKLEFFDAAKAETGDFSKSSMIEEAGKKIEDLNSDFEGTSISLSAESTVGAVEKLFKEEVGIYVQVFRKSNQLWLETTSTDDWTLAQQNTKGEEMASAVKAEEKDFDAFREQE